MQTHAPNKKFCFLIDGLDEYDGDHYDIIDIMQDMVKAPHVKICLSSRPRNCFKDKLGNIPDRKLYLHDLTRQDIELYARAKLPMARKSRTLEYDSIAHDLLVLDIVDRAQGVFLWVYLVVRSLRQGMGNGDSVATLQLRLKELPA